MMLLLLACVGAAPVTTARTDGGSWELVLHDETVPMGRAPVDIVVSPLAAQPVEGLAIAATATMGGMDHDDADLLCEELGEGVYALTGWWSMRGRWRLTGTITHEARSEAFLLELDVE